MYNTQLVSNTKRLGLKDLDLDKCFQGRGPECVGRGIAIEIYRKDKNREPNVTLESANLCVGKSYSENVVSGTSKSDLVLKDELSPMDQHRVIRNPIYALCAKLKKHSTAYAAPHDTTEV